MYKVLKGFYDIMNETLECVLYSSDLEAFINLAIIKLQTTYTEVLRTKLFKVLEQLTVFEDYYKSSYKIDALTEILESYETADEVSEDNRNLASKILENIRLHQ